MKTLLITATLFISVAAFAQKEKDLETVSFEETSEAPVFPGCLELHSEEQNRKCFSEKVIWYVNSNFNTVKVRPYAKKGRNKLFVHFVITKDGNVTQVHATGAPNEILKEAERAVKSLPHMKPAKVNGEPVNVQYHLPIVFMVEK
ncbi:hypothetical protein C7S20_07930 [Christiangramia fulva]|uniref:TonB C-terminal domain-containing protein n=1 Tax=Christiangramia fulva TaxID=2126553 RepID=A0A2R3Z4K0_9FLAO|nr:energy transducer TonB [Christiangramia fulva]AVR45203.1 hypothetical protein C7S20_07930 [Christiangramia fulva]